VKDDYSGSMECTVWKAEGNCDHKNSIERIVEKFIFGIMDRFL